MPSCADGIKVNNCNNCNAIFDMNCIKRTSFHTLTKSKTSKITFFRSAIRYESHHGAILYSIVFIICICILTCSCTFYKCNFTNRFTNFLTHDRTDFCCYCSTTNWTGTNFCFAFCNRCSKTGTSGKTTATTVISRKSC